MKNIKLRLAQIRELSIDPSSVNDEDVSEDGNDAPVKHFTTVIYEWPGKPQS